MKSIEANFAQPTQPARWCWLLLAALAAAAGYLAYAAWHERVALGEARLALQEQEAAARESAATLGPVHSPAQPYDASARQLWGERHAVWPQALQALESNIVPGVTLQSLEFAAADGGIRIEVSAPGHAAAVELLNALNQSNIGMADELGWSLLRSVAAGDGAGAKAQMVGRVGGRDGLAGR